jgi:hypothetical protein
VFHKEAADGDGVVKEYRAQLSAESSDCLHSASGEPTLRAYGPMVADQAIKSLYFSNLITITVVIRDIEDHLR